MIVYRDGMNWIVERDTGEKISLTNDEIQDIYWFIRRESLWEDWVAGRMKDIDAFDGANGAEIAAVEKKKDNILNYIMEQEYRTDDVMYDIVWDAIEKFCPDVYNLS